MLYVHFSIQIYLVGAISYDVALSKRLPCVGGTKEAAQPVAAIAADESSEARKAASELANDAD